MRERVRALLGVSRLASFVGTFHSWGLRFLRRAGGADGRTAAFSIADSGDQAGPRARGDGGAIDFGADAHSRRRPLAHFRGEVARSFHRRERRARPTDFAAEKIASIYSVYEKKLRAGNAFDFDDLIGVSVRLLESSEPMRNAEQRSIAHLLIDEYQDTNGAQDALVKLIGAAAESLVAVGDEDQSIYRWRGARVEHILRFEEDFPGATVVSLDAELPFDEPDPEGRGGGRVREPPAPREGPRRRVGGGRTGGGALVSRRPVRGGLDRFPPRRCESTPCPSRQFSSA